jgi:hypothetical protein
MCGAQIMKPIVYGLIDPLESDHVRYAGVATDPRRTKSHRAEALNPRSKVLTHKEHWIQKLLGARCSHVHMLVDTCNGWWFAARLTAL